MRSPGWAWGIGPLLTVATLGCDSTTNTTRASESFFDLELIEFGSVPIGQVASRSTRLRNSGGRTILVQSVRFEPETGAFGAFLSEGGTLNGARIPGGQAVEVEVRFGPLAEQSYDARMVVATEDATLELPIEARGRLEQPPTPRLEPNRILFGDIAVGGRARQRFWVQNEGDVMGRLAAVQAVGAAFSTSSIPLGGDGNPLAVEPGDRVELDVTYRPTSAGALDSGQLVVSFDAGPMAALELQGRGVAAVPGLRCPEQPTSMGVIPRGELGEAVVSCTLLDAGWVLTSSNATAGSSRFFSIDRLNRPGGDRLDVQVIFRSVAVAGLQSADFDLFGPLGLSERVTVTASIGAPSPASADLILELRWDSSRGDLDLHLVREGGQPFELADDCFFASKNPDWGEVGAALDNPFLDRDDRSGFGPETISLIDARETSYDVFVQYHDPSGGLGQRVTARVAWSSRSGPSGRLETILPGCGAWWHVGSFRLGAGPEFAVVDQVSEAYREEANCPE